MTVQELLYDARALIDEYVDGETIIAPDDVPAIQANGIRFINMALQEIYEESKTFNEFEIVNKRIPNLLGDLNQFNIVEFIGTDQEYPANGITGAKAYFFTADDDFTVYIQEYDGVSWNNLITITETPTTRTDYRGLITPTDTSYPIRMVFSGTTFYRHFNRCLYSYPFKADSIPDYKPWVRYDMPSDFGELDKIVKEEPVRRYNIDTEYKWENYKTLAINYLFEGTLKVIYKVSPTVVTNVTDKVTVNNLKALQFIRFFVASMFATTENPDLYNPFAAKASEMKFDALKQQPSAEVKIQDVYFSGGA